MFCLFLEILNELFIFSILFLDLNMNYQVLLKKKSSSKKTMKNKVKTINNLLSNTHNNKSEYLAIIEGPLQTFFFSTRET